MFDTITFLYHPWRPPFSIPSRPSLRTHIDLVSSSLLLRLVEDVDVPARVICYKSSVSLCMLLHADKGHLQVPYGRLKRFGFLPNESILAISAGRSSTSWKFCAIRAGVTDLGMTLWPPTCDHAKLYVGSAWFARPK